VSESAGEGVAVAGVLVSAANEGLEELALPVGLKGDALSAKHGDVSTTGVSGASDEKRNDPRESTARGLSGDSLDYL
jgi:hypothetical protein